MAKHDETELAMDAIRGLMAVIRLATDQLESQYAPKPASLKLNIVKMKQGKRGPKSRRKPRAVVLKERSA